MKCEQSRKQTLVLYFETTQAYRNWIYSRFKQQLINTLYKYVSNVPFALTIDPDIITEITVQPMCINTVF